MPLPLRAFLWMFVIITLFGFLVGTLNLANPDAVHIPFGEGKSAEGLDGILASTLSSAVLGCVFGGIAAFATWLFSLGERGAQRSVEDVQQQGNGDT